MRLNNSADAKNTLQTV